MKKTVRIEVDDEAHRLAKVSASWVGMTLSEWIGVAIAEKASREKKMIDAAMAAATKGGKKAA